MGALAERSGIRRWATDRADFGLKKESNCDISKNPMYQKKPYYQGGRVCVYEFAFELGVNDGIIRWK